MCHVGRPMTMMTVMLTHRAVEVSSGKIASGPWSGLMLGQEAKRSFSEHNSSGDDRTAQDVKHTLQ